LKQAVIEARRKPGTAEEEEDTRSDSTLLWSLRKREEKKK